MLREEGISRKNTLLKHIYISSFFFFFFFFFALLPEIMQELLLLLPEQDIFSCPVRNTMTF